MQLLWRQGYLPGVGRVVELKGGLVAQPLDDPFSEPEIIDPKIKGFIWGPWGSGKTYFGLNAPGPVRVIDTEGGTDMFAGMFPFKVLKSKSSTEIHAALDWIEANPDKIGTLLIDPITIVYTVIADAAHKAAVAKAIRKAERSQQRYIVDPDEVTLPGASWGRIKRQYNGIMTRLLALPCHVLLTARQKDEYDIKPNGDMSKIGVKADAEKGTGYNFDVVIRADVQGDQRIWTIEKARGHVGAVLPLGSQWANPTFESLFNPVFDRMKALAKETKQKPVARTATDEEQAIIRDTEVMGERVASPELAAEFAALIESRGYDPEIVRQNRQWPPFTELSERTIREAMAALQGQAPASPEPPAQELSASPDAARDAEIEAILSA